MCGIAGIVIFGSGQASPASADGRGALALRAAERMVERLRHRGPDGEGTSLVGGGAAAGAALGHTRLAILDLSCAGRQPMVSDDGAVHVTFNGEIYNFHALRTALGGDGTPQWRSTSDTEVLLRGYARWGKDVVHRLRGMFAFALWDQRRRELFLARDRFGIKPLYYYQGDGFAVFASEVRALLATGLVPPTLDSVALWDFLGFQTVPAPRTLVAGVRLLPPGTWLTLGEQGQVEQRQYWDLLRDRNRETPASSAAARARMGELLREAVALHMVSDVPVGAFLSGGIDSSAIVGLMRATQGNGAELRTFTVGFAEQDYDETRYARRVAERFHTEHTELLLSDADVLRQVPAALAAMDQPSGDGVNSYVVSRAVREAGIKVALSGLGGDELFAGYPSFRRIERATRLLRGWGRVPRRARAAAGDVLRSLGPASVRTEKLAGLLGSDGTAATLYPLLREVLSSSQRASLLSAQSLQDLRGALGVDDLRDRVEPYEVLLHEALSTEREADVVAAVSYAEARTYMHDVLLRDTDQMSMAHALEVRVPFLDHEVAEYAVGLRADHKRPHGTPKRLLVESLGDLLPEEVVYRPKRGFTLPLDVWMRGPLRSFCDDRLRQLAKRPPFRSDAVDGLWRAFLQRHPSVTWSRVWLLVALEEWLQQALQPQPTHIDATRDGTEGKPHA